MVYYVSFCFFFFKQKTAYEMRISDWSSDVCSSDLARRGTFPSRCGGGLRPARPPHGDGEVVGARHRLQKPGGDPPRETGAEYNRGNESPGRLSLRTKHDGRTRRPPGFERGDAGVRREAGAAKTGEGRGGKEGVGTGKTRSGPKN